MLAESVESTSLADEVAFRIEADILDGTFLPGARLTQEQVCERFGVSRTPVREALRKLQARNLVVAVPNKGVTVRVPTRKELEDAYNVRSELEGYACQLAAAQATDDLLFELQSVQHRMADLMSRLAKREHKGGEQLPGIHYSLSRANDEFHGLMRKAADNNELDRLVEGLGRVFPKDYSWRAIKSSEEMQELNLEEHSRVYAAIAAGDGVGARQAMSAHVLHAGTTLINYLDGLGFWK